MARLIDADKIVNGIALYMTENAYLNDTPLDALKMVANWITDAPTVDAVPVVRCRDCKYWQDNNDDYPHEECRWGHGETPDDNDFCSTENGKKVLIDAAFLPDKETAETVHSLSGWAYKSNSQEQRATV